MGIVPISFFVGNVSFVFHYFRYHIDQCYFFFIGIVSIFIIIVIVSISYLVIGIVSIIFLDIGIVSIRFSYRYPTLLL